MSVEATLIIVKQMYDVACLPRMVEAESGMTALVDSLKHFCSSPDSRVRFYACKTLAALSKGYNDILKAQSVDWIVPLHKGFHSGCNEGDSVNAKVLSEVMASLGMCNTSEDDKTPFGSPQTMSSSGSDADAITEITADYLDDQVDSSIPEYISEERNRQTKINTLLFRLESGRGDLVDLSDRLIATVQTRLVTVAGVVSAFINADFLVLTVRGQLRKDINFMQDVSTAMAEATDSQYRAVVCDDEKAAVESTKAESDHDPVDASYLDDDERLAARAGVKSQVKPPLGVSPPLFSFFSNAPSQAVNGLNTAQAYARDLELIEFNTQEVAAAKQEIQQEETKKKMGFFRRWFSRG